VNIPTRLVSGKSVANVVKSFRTSRVMLDRGRRTVILPRINGTMLLRSQQPTVHDVGRWLNLIAKIIPKFRMEERVYFATRVEELLLPQEGLQEGDFIRGLRSISVSIGHDIHFKFKLTFLSTAEFCTISMPSGNTLRSLLLSPLNVVNLSSSLM
jgi:hypothetical protein